jgi:hypothetical protein
MTDTLYASGSQQMQALITSKESQRGFKSLYFLTMISPALLICQNPRTLWKSLLKLLKT